MFEKVYIVYSPSDIGKSISQNKFMVSGINLERHISWSKEIKREPLTRS